VSLQAVRRLNRAVRIGVERMRIVLDTSVLVAAARSRRGASYALVSLIRHRGFAICLSVGLYLEELGKGPDVVHP
jgi:hypothetical protein